MKMYEMQFMKWWHTAHLSI